MDNSRLFKIGFILVFLGIIIVVLVPIIMVLTTTSGSSETHTGFGGCIVIFFIPICFGAGSPELVPLLIIIALALTLALILLLPLLLRKTIERIE